MSEAPKKIWLETEDYSESMLWFLKMKTNGATPYIRADIVEEMRQALTELCRLADSPKDADYKAIFEAWNTAKSALKRLEEE